MVGWTEAVDVIETVAEVKQYGSAINSTVKRGVFGPGGHFGPKVIFTYLYLRCSIQVYKQFPVLR